MNGMDHVKENVLQENDRYANRFMISVLSVSCGIFFIILFLFETEARQRRHGRHYRQNVPDRDDCEYR